MDIERRNMLLQATVLVLGVIGPFLFPAYIQQISLLWIMLAARRTAGNTVTEAGRRRSNAHPPA